MPNPQAFADAIAGISRIDTDLAEARATWVAHQRCGHNQCATGRLALASLDRNLDRRLEHMRIRDLEIVWVQSGGTEGISL